MSPVELVFCTVKYEVYCAVDVHCTIAISRSYIRYLYDELENDLMLPQRKVTVNLQNTEYSSTEPANQDLA